MVDVVFHEHGVAAASPVEDFEKNRPRGGGREAACTMAAYGRGGCKRSALI